VKSQFEANLDEELRRANSYSRLGVLVAAYREAKCRRKLGAWFAKLRQEWSCCDNVWFYAPELRNIFLDNREHWGSTMDEAETRALRGLPATVTCFRGCGLRNLLGLSWTLSRAVAKRFPVLRRYRADYPLLVCAEVPRELVVAVKLDRNEKEVVACVDLKHVVEIVDIRKQVEREPLKK
jgi:hypothetical protein